ncbi:hypothetical protein DL98DRAFT_583756 [Cadophora sp. DSE1049]|nr:hypothetical protein DL98DRAFT_583756 [Cadophora sp. DSE1049]
MLPSGTTNNVSETGQSDGDLGDRESAKLTKRARYVLRACAQCQTRKIRCEGGIPCSKCVARGRECVASSSQQTPPLKKRAARSSDSRTLAAGTAGSSDQSAIPGSSSTLTGKSRVSTSELLNRVIGVERQMKAVMSSGARISLEADERNTPTQSTESAISHHGSPESALNRGDSDRQTFIGEVSMHELAQAKEQLDDLPVQYSETSPLSNGAPFSPKGRTLQRHVSDPDAQKRSRSWLREILFSHGVVPEQLECRTFLEVFFDEVHVLYPFLHPPSVWRTFDYLWKQSLLVSSDDIEKSGESRLSVALMFICLALGRCTASSRIDNADGAHSAGWTLYNVAMDLVPSFFDIASDSAISLHGLQVVYLFRLDASEKAERTLAHAISSAHILGLHRKGFYTGMSVFDDEMFTRVWWGIYLLDRRLSLESGRPFLIQDANIETRTPLNVSDDWLAQRQSATTTLSDLAVEIEAETSLAQHNAMPYLVAFISQSRIATDVWKAIYNTKQTAGSMPGMVYDYLDIALDNWWQTLPPYLKYHESVPYEDQFSDIAWWQVKQCLSLHMRYAFFKLLIRRPSRPLSGTSTPSHSHIAAEAYCAQRAASIIDIFDRIPKTFPRYAFTLMHPMTSATMILYSITFRNPALRDIHGNTLLSAVQSLVSYCQRTWVSSKMIRTVSKLNRMVQKSLNQPVGKSAEKVHDRVDDQEQGQPHGNSDWDLLQYRMMSSPPIGDPARSNGPVSPPPARPDRVMLSPVSTGFERSQHQVIQPQSMAQRPSRIPSSRQDTVDDSVLWPSTSVDSAFTGLPSWATNDFDFEQAFSGYSNGRVTGFRSEETSSFDDEWAQSLGGYIQPDYF